MASPRARREQGSFVVEGPRLIQDALEAGVRVEHLLVEDRHVTPGSGEGSHLWPLAERVLHQGGQVWLCSSRAMRAVADTQTPQGVVAVVRWAPGTARDWQQRGSLALLVDGVQDPGNVGTMVRSACGAGADAVLCSWDSADPFGPKAVRASAGAVFRIPVERLDPSETLDCQVQALQRQGWQVAALEPHGGQPYDRADLTGRLAVVVGSEGGGVSPSVRECCQLRLTVPLAGGVESLNAAVAASVVLFEAARQRRHAAGRPG